MSDAVAIAVDRALAETGYLRGRQGGDLVLADGLRTYYNATTLRLEPAFSQRAGLMADAVYETDEGPQLIIKGVRDGDGPVKEIREKAWNLSLAPLLWIVTPVEVRVYDAYRGVGEDKDHAPLGTYRIDVAADMAALDAACGRFSVDTGAFWTSGIAKEINRSSRVDRVLLEEIAALEDELVNATPPGPGGEATAREQCQELVTCVLFASYLWDREMAQPLLPPDLGPDLAGNLTTREGALSLFAWLHRDFNGDVFPEGIGRGLRAEHLPLLVDFVRGTHLTKRSKGQMRLFRFRFDTLPIELISAVYEAFARRAAADMAKTLGLHYTPLALVHMALDPVFEGLGADARILDPTCGSGLFLVESLRRLVWKRCGEGARPRATVRSVLYGQVHGIDVQRAALRIAAFSLYLAALELETTCEPGEPIRFEGLIGRSLHELDFLGEQALALASRLGVAAVVGNPPWTHGVIKRDGEAHANKRRFVKRKTPRRSANVEVPLLFVSDSGHTMVAPNGLDSGDEDADVGARRSPDQLFFLKALRIVGSEGRMAMYLKAAPILASSPEASSFRSTLFRKVRRLALLNLSPLRHAKLFPGAQSPGMLVCANCGNLPDDDTILVGTFALTADFARTGMLSLSSADVREVEKDRLKETPGILKAAMLGTYRDMLLIESLGRRFGTLGDLLEKAGVPNGRGYQRKGDGPRIAVPEDMRHLPALESKEYRALSLDGVFMPSLAERGQEDLFRLRSRKLYSQPLLVFPKARHVEALQAGRTSAALSSRDIAFSENFYGVSFAGADARLAPILCALLNSDLAGYQFLFGLGALGTERPSVSKLDFLGLRVPDFEVTDALARDASEALARAEEGDLRGLDGFAARLYGLRPSESELVADAIRRGRSAFLDTHAAREDDSSTPELGRLRDYASAACRTVNAVLGISRKRHLTAQVTLPRGGGGDPLEAYAAVRFRMRSGWIDGEVVDEIDQGDAAGLFDGVLGSLSRSPTPYLRERRSVRIYDGPMVTVLKPAQKRYWNAAVGMQDGDAILADHPPGGN